MGEVFFLFFLTLMFSTWHGRFRGEIYQLAWLVDFGTHINDRTILFLFFFSHGSVHDEYNRLGTFLKAECLNLITYLVSFCCSTMMLCCRSAEITSYTRK